MENLVDLRLGRNGIKTLVRGETITTYLDNGQSLTVVPASTSCLLYGFSLWLFYILTFRKTLNVLRNMTVEYQMCVPISFVSMDDWVLAYKSAIRVQEVC